MTVQLVGSTDDIGHEQMDEMLQSARDAFSSTRAVEASLSRVLYHPEAIMLAVEPVQELRTMQQLLRTATESAIGRADDAIPAEWVPHITIAYSTAEQPAKRIIQALGLSIPPKNFVIDQVSLVIQWGPERDWRWDEVGVVELSTTVGLKAYRRDLAGGNTSAIRRTRRLGC